MPQISPLWWFVLFVYFTILFLVFVVNVYYFFVPVGVVGNLARGSGVVGMSWNW